MRVDPCELCDVPWTVDRRPWTVFPFPLNSLKKSKPRSNAPCPLTKRQALRDEIARRIEAIESAYEFMLAYAAQGAVADSAVTSGTQLRDLLKGFDEGVDGLAENFRQLIDARGLDPATYSGFLDVLARDATSTAGALRMVRAQTAISSQLIDNLNASIHVRALLTDVFLVDELLHAV